LGRLKADEVGRVVGEATIWWDGKARSRREGRSDRDVNVN
jgi:hypothetical protein